MESLVSQSPVIKNSANFRHWIEFLFGNFGLGGRGADHPTPPSRVQWLLRMGLFCALCYVPLRKMTIYCHSSIKGHNRSPVEPPQTSSKFSQNVVTSPSECGQSQKCLLSSNSASDHRQNTVSIFNHKKNNYGPSINQANWTAGESYLLKIFLKYLNWKKMTLDHLPQSQNLNDLNDFMPPKLPHHDWLFSYLPMEFKWKTKGFSNSFDIFSQKFCLTTNPTGGLNNFGEKSVFIIDPQIFLKSLIRQHDAYYNGTSYHHEQESQINSLSTNYIEPILSQPAILDRKMDFGYHFENECSFLPKFTNPVPLAPHMDAIFVKIAPTLVSVGDQKYENLNTFLESAPLSPTCRVRQNPPDFQIGGKICMEKILETKKINLWSSLNQLLSKKLFETENLTVTKNHPKIIDTTRTTVFRRNFENLENIENLDSTQNRKLYHLIQCQKEAWSLFERQTKKFLTKKGKNGFEEMKLRKKLEFLKNASIIYFQRLSTNSSHQIGCPTDDQPMIKRKGVSEKHQGDRFIEILSLSNKKWLQFGLSVSRAVFGLWEKMTVDMDSFGISWLQPPHQVNSMLSAQDLLEKGSKNEKKIEEDDQSVKIMRQQIEAELSQLCENYLQAQLSLNAKKVELTLQRKELTKKLNRLDKKIEQKRWKHQVKICAQEFQKKDKILKLEAQKFALTEEMTGLTNLVQNVEQQYLEKGREAQEVLKNGGKRRLAQFELIRREEEAHKIFLVEQETKMREFITLQRKRRVGRVLNFFGLNFINLPA